MSDSEEILMELDDSNITFSAKYSHSQKYVFFITDIYCDPSIGISQINVMFRGEDSIVHDIVDIRLGVLKNDSFTYLGSVVRDLQNSDPRVFVNKDWTATTPLPLGSMSQYQNADGESDSKLCIIILTLSSDFNIQMVKFGADIVPLSKSYKKQGIKHISHSKIFINNGTISNIENALDAFDIALLGIHDDALSFGNDSGCESDSSAEPQTWIDVLDSYPYVKKPLKKNRI
jgi:hypothetical protein